MSNPIKIAALIASTGVLAACGNNDLERGLSGAAIGCAAGEVIGDDCGTGAAVGAVGGVFSDNVGLTN